MDIGARKGYFRNLVGHKVLNLIETEYGESNLSANSGVNISKIVTDDEVLPFANIDLILSNLNLHFVNDLPGALVQIKHALTPGGIFIGTMFAHPTLSILKEAMLEYELNKYNQVSPHIIPMVDLTQAASLLQRAGFAMPVVDSFEIQAEYDSLLGLFKDLKGMGETNILKKMKNYGLSKDSLLEIEQIYRKLCDGKIIANFEILTLTGFRS